MTTFHDQPPQSRRAARESERAVQTDSGVDYTAQFDQPSESTTPPSGRRARSDSSASLFEVPNAEPLTYSTQARDPQTPPPVAAPSDAEQGFRVRDYSPEGRRSAAYPSQPAAPTNLDYRTLAGPGLEHPSEAQVPAPAAWQPPPSSPPEPAQPMSRREARAMREAADAAAGVVPLVEPEVPTAAPTALTNAMAEFEALTRAAPPPVAEVTEPPHSESFLAPESEPETYTTRIPGPAAAQRVDDVPPPTGAFSFLPPVVEPVDEPAAVVEPEPVALVEPAPEPEPVALVEPAPEPEPVALVEPEPEPQPEPEPVALVEPEPIVEPEPAPLFSSHPSNVFQQFAPPTADPVAEIVESPEPVQPSPESAEASAWPFTGLQPTVAPDVAHEALPEETVEQLPAWAIPTPAAVSEPEPLVRETYTPPVGHWSRQADLDDENDVFENTLSREVGGSNVSTATSALILPNIPQANDFGSLINGTGEILITGTIDLPQSLGTMGGDARRYDDPSVDHMFDAFDGEVVSNDSAPVRAIRAVSTHTSSRGVIQAAKPQGNRVLLTAAIITVSVLVVGVVGLLAAYIITGMN